MGRPKAYPIVVMKLVVKESSEKRKSRHDLPTPKKASGQRDKSDNEIFLRLFRSWSLPESPMRRSLIRKS